MTPHENKKLFTGRGRNDSREKTDVQNSLHTDAPFPKWTACRPREAAQFSVRPSGLLTCTADPLVCIHRRYL